jgi:cysteine synthase A
MIDKLKELNNLIGNTPLVGIRYRYKGKISTIYSKCEYYNYTGSIKDRMAYYILEAACKKGELTCGTTIVEATSGNTGIAFSALGSFLGLKVKIIMPDWMSAERKNMIKAFGAELVLISKEEGGFLGSIKLSEDMAKQDKNIFLPCQFSNRNNLIAHQKTTGIEVLKQLAQLDLKPTAFVAGVGTGGTVIGVGKAFRSKYPDAKIHPLEPAESPTLTTGYRVGSHRIQGISDEFIPRIMSYDKWDSVISVSDGDSIIMSRKLAGALGLAVGISSGANFIGAVMLKEKYGMDSVVSTVFADDSKKYLSTDYVKEEPIKEIYLAPKIELLDIISCNRIRK